MDYITPGMIGKSFEKRVRTAFENQGFKKIFQNQWNRNYALEKDNAKKREFDLVLYNPFQKQFYIIECKAHMKREILVTPGMISEFANKINIYSGRTAYNLMVTDTDYTGRARDHAEKNKILLMNGKELEQFEKKKSKQKQDSLDFWMEMSLLAAKLFLLR